VDLAAGQQHACAVDDGGDVWCWGQLAPLGGVARADAGTDPNVAYVGSLREGLRCD
jgi:alpha-tubulin suppressor-like RCC1 family protein